MLNDLADGINRLYIPLTGNTANGNYPAKAGLTGLPPGIANTGFPDITFVGPEIPVNWGGTNLHVNVGAQTSYTVQDNVLWTKGRHHATFGFQWQALQDNFNNPSTGSLAAFNFNANQTADFTSAGAINTNTGLAYANLANRRGVGHVEHFGVKCLGITIEQIGNLPGWSGVEH